MATRKRDRLFAGFGALLFLITASALTIAIVVSNISSKNSKNSNSSNTSQNSLNPQTCGQDAQNEVELPPPTVYQPTEPVTALQTTDLVQGTGTPVKVGDCLVVKYYGTLAKNGQKFDENFTTNIGFEFSLGEGEVIQGWDKGLVGMKPGGTRRLVIPSALGYGNQAAGSIPANSDLVFVVKLLRVIPNAAPQQ